MKDNAKTIKIRDILFWSIIVVTIFGGTLYHLGYRFTGGLNIGKIGIITMEIPFKATTIFIDQSKKIETTKDNQLVEISLSPIAHQIIVSHDGYFPWIKKIRMPSSGNVTLNPIFISQNTSGVMITKSDSQYWKIRNGVTSNAPPTKTNPLISKDGPIEIWVEDKTIVAKNGVSTSTVLKSETTIRNIDFYKNRSDSVIFSTGDSVSVIEISTEGTQNFFPIYKGMQPRFVTADSNSIYVLDGETVMQVTI